MHREQIKELALSNGFKLKPQPDGSEDLNPYVYEFAQALVDSLLPKASPGCFEVPRMSEEFELPVDCNKGYTLPGSEAELHLFGDQAVAGAYAINNHDSIRAASLMSARDAAALAEEVERLKVLLQRIDDPATAFIEDADEIVDLLRAMGAGNTNALADAVDHAAGELTKTLNETPAQSLAAHDAEMIEPILQKLLAAQRATSDIAQAALVDEAADMCLRLSQQVQEVQS